MDAFKVYVIAIVTAVITLIGTLGFIKYSQLKSMERNIESAISKGIDPIAVRCSYDDNSWICMQYASTHAKDQKDQNTSKK